MFSPVSRICEKTFKFVIICVLVQSLGVFGFESESATSISDRLCPNTCILNMRVCMYISVNV